MIGNCVVGIDLGGTNLRVGLFVDDKLVALEVRSSSLSPQERLDPCAVVDVIIRELAGQHGPQAIGVVASGPVRVSEGRIDNPSTLPDWSGSDWPTQLSDRVGVPLVMENDAVAAGLGEYYHGGTGAFGVMCMVTVGTGIGVAVVRGDEAGPYRGADSFHPEAGHMIIGDGGPECYCGHSGCWEMRCSGTAIRDRWETIGSDGIRTIDWSGYAHEFARGIVNLCRVYAPDRIVLAGGVADNFAELISPLRRELAYPDPMGPRKPIMVIRAQLAEPGLHGAAYLAARMVSSNERE